LLKQIDDIQKLPVRRKHEHPDEPYSEFMPNGKHKPRPAESIRSYNDFQIIQSYFKNAGRMRDWAIWTIGVSLGLRISDLFNLKYKNVFNSDGTFRPRIFLYEQKTGKLNNCLITESVQYALKTYLDSINNQYNMEDYIFSSQKTKGKVKMAEKYGWKILSDAGKELDIPIIIGSHTMRKSFANIAACADKSYVDMNTVSKIQGLLNHSDQKCTMKYLGSYQKMYDGARRAVSDFVMGKSNITDIVAGENNSINDILEKLESIELKLTDRR
jgi:integrase